MVRPAAMTVARAGLLAALGFGCGPNVADFADAQTSGQGPDAAVSVDGDGDGYPAGNECDDADSNIHPNAPEICDDSIDNNCNGLIDTDVECLSACERAVQSGSYFGCRIYAVDLPQYSLDKLFGISLSNPSDTEMATGTISTVTGVIATFTIAPRGVYTYENGLRATTNAPSSGVYNRAYLIESDQPLAGYQFNSLDTIGAASTDASLLFAEHSLATLYFTMDYQSRDGDDSFIAIYATEPDTLVEIMPTAAVSGSTIQILQPFDVMVVTAQGANTSLTGSRVSADKPVGVFGGNRCTNVPYGMSYCDHLEEQIFPRQALGESYIVAKTHMRGSCLAEDYIRVMADDDGTTVTFEPAVIEPRTLGAGEWLEISIIDSVEVTATRPIFVGQFLRSSNGSECSEEGDPAFILQVPIDQYRRDYSFLTPPTYQTDYVDILAPVGATVTLDGQPVALSSGVIGATNFSLTSLVIEDGAHTIDASDPVGVMVYGFGGPTGTGTQNVSYGYPAGLDLTPINPVE